MPHATVALTAKYLNVRQRKLGTIIIQTVRILQHESAVTDSLPEEEFVHGHYNHFQMTKPGGDRYCFGPAGGSVNDGE
jgi:hypothetical protein